MTETQATPAMPVYSSPSTGVFGTKIPSSVCFIIGTLLFLLPFAELKCTSTTGVQESLMSLNVGLTKSGLDLALGNDWKTPDLGDTTKEKLDMAKKENPSEPNYFAVVALAIAVIGVALSFTNQRAWAAVNTVGGVLGAAALVALMIDLKKNTNDVISKLADASDNESLFGGMKFTLVFTSWIYVAMIALLAAAFFSYKRMKTLR